MPSLKLQPSASPLPCSPQKHLFGFLRRPFQAGACLLAALVLGYPGAALTQTFHSTGEMVTPRSFHFAVRLRDGRVLLGGGVSSATPGSVLSSAELYDPAKGVFTGTGALLTPRYGAASILLRDGDVLVAGGSNNSGPYGFNPLQSAELYHPATNTFSATGEMDVARANPVLVKTATDAVFVLGDEANCPSYPCTETVQRYDESSGTFVTVGALLLSRIDPAVCTLSNGEILIVSGYITGSPATAASFTAEVFDPATGASRFTAGSPQADEEHPPAVRLLSGPERSLVLLAGNPHHSAPSTIAETYDPATDSFTALTALLHVPRVNLTATWLRTHEVLLAGGDATGTAELYQPVTHDFSALIPMLAPRMGHTATLLDDGDVLIAGGAASGSPSAELFVPAH